MTSDEMRDRFILWANQMATDLDQRLLTEAVFVGVNVAGDNIDDARSVARRYAALAAAEVVQRLLRRDLLDGDGLARLIEDTP